MRYFDTFTGYGGFTLGIQRAYELANRYKKTRQPEVVLGDSNSPSSHDVQRTPTCIGYSEINKYAIQVYEKHFPKHKPYGDITKINAAELPDFDLLTGGFPCQAFSIAGKRQGFDDTRGTLFFDIARILKEKLPRNFILENVKGLLSHDNGRTFKVIITTLTELGYCVEWQVLNAKDFGVPQNRERVFIVGHFGGVPERKVFPIGASNEKNTKPNGQRSSQHAQAITGQGGKNARGTFIEQLNNPTHSNNRLYGEQGISPTGIDTGGLQDMATAIDANYHKGHGQRGKSRGRTLALQDMKIRRLTPLECERLMGLPDNWTAEGTEGKMSDTQRYKLCGNGVVVNVVEEIVRRLYNLTP